MPRIIQPAGPGNSSSGGGAVSVPAEMLDESRRRVGVAALALGALWLVAILLNDVLRPALSDPRYALYGWSSIQRVVAFAAVLLSFATAYIARWSALSTRSVLRAGIGFQVICAAFVTLVARYDVNTRAPGMSWVCLVILAYPMIAPMPPVKTFLAGLACAAIDSIAVLMARGGQSTPLVGGAYGMIWLLMPPYLCALLTVVPARVITRLSRQVRRARDLGSYTLGELLGRGGMGEVYRAEHRLLARPAAIKLIQPRLLEDSTPEQARSMVERFQREAEAVARLRSPHTVSLYDFGVTDDGTMFYVMELLDGLSMEDLVWRHGPLPEERAIHLLRQVCISLQEAHASGLVHRDVKPGNIHVCRLGPVVDFVKVLDFGLVKGTERELAAGSNLTMPGMMTGTPAFMAPELFVGGTPDARADVYAIGCVAYWLLTGQLPFAGQNAVQLVAQVLSDEPPPPSEVAHRSISPALDALVLRCLSKEPTERPQDAGALVALLDACTAPEPWTTQRATWWWSAYMEAAA